MTLHENDIDTRKIELKLRGASNFLESLLPQTEEQIEKAKRRLGATPIEIPSQLLPENLIEQITGFPVSDSDATQTLGCLIKVLRTEKKLSLQDLSEKSGIDLDDLSMIEKDCTYYARPMTVSKLAKFFKLAPSKLALLANHVKETDAALHDEPLRFAACSGGNFSDLSTEEKKLFHAYIKQLKSFS